MSTAARRRLMRDFKVRSGVWQHQTPVYPLPIAVTDEMVPRTAHANRPTCWRLRLSRARQRHDVVCHICTSLSDKCEWLLIGALRQERRYHRPSRHAL